MVWYGWLVGGGHVLCDRLFPLREVSPPVEPSCVRYVLKVVKIDYDHAPCTRPKLPAFNTSAEQVTFALAKNMPTGGKLAVFKSNFNEGGELFIRQKDIEVDAGGSFTLDVQLGDFYTVSTVMTASKGAPENKIPVRSRNHLFLVLDSPLGFSNKTDVYLFLHACNTGLVAVVPIAAHRVFRRGQDFAGG